MLVIYIRALTYCVFIFLKTQSQLWGFFLEYYVLPQVRHNVLGPFLPVT